MNWLRWRRAFGDLTHGRLCRAVSMGRSSGPGWAVPSWRRADAELCGHHQAWNESGFVRLFQWPVLNGFASWLTHPEHQGASRASACHYSLHDPPNPTGKKEHRGPCGCWRRSRWERVPLVWGEGLWGRWSDHSTRHQPSCTGVLLAASYEGHVCAAGPGHVQAAPCQVGGVPGKASCTG